MWRHLFVIAICYVLLSVQSSLGESLESGWFRPWLPGIALVSCATILPGPAGLIWAACLGLMTDCLSGAHMGLNFLAATISAGCLQFLRGDRESMGLFTLTWGAFVVIVAWRTLVLLLGEVVEQNHWDQPLDIATILQESVSTVFLLMAALLVVRVVRYESQLDPGTSVSNRWSMLSDW